MADWYAGYRVSWSHVDSGRLQGQFSVTDQAEGQLALMYGRSHEHICELEIREFLEHARLRKPTRRALQIEGRHLLWKNYVNAVVWIHLREY